MAKYDVLLYGATGFTGLLTARYLDTVPGLAGKRWAIAGRTQSKLVALAAELTSGPGVVCCALEDAAAVAAMVQSTRVVLTCAGPYSAYNGQALLGACAKAGVHYSDLAGEGFWQREMIDAHDATARTTGARIVLGGGVDSIPSDLGAAMALKALSPAAGASVSVKGVYTEYTGSFSGGTLNSGKATAEAKKEGRLTVARAADPYILGPELGDGFIGPDTVNGTPSGMPEGWKRSWFSDGYTLLIDFFMAPINARVVRRSFALQGVAATTSYTECCSAAMWGRALCVWLSRGFGYFVGEPINFKPKSGEGPPSWLLECGTFCVNVTATDASTGSVATAVVRGKGDPGYGATSKMLAETGLCLAFDDLSIAPAEGNAGGVLTPSTALGDVLITRLRAANGGDFMSLEVSGGGAADKKSASNNTPSDYGYSKL